MTRATALTIALLLLLPSTAPAFHYVTPTLLQVTPVNADAGAVANARWGGLRYVVFDTDADLLGTGSVGRQVFLFDLRDRDLLGTQAVFQLTSGPGNSQHGTSNKNGYLVVYDTKPGGVGPRQLYFLDRRTGERSALTQGLADSTNATMDESGRTVVFESSANFFSTVSTGVQIYAIDLHKADPTCPYPCPATDNAGLRQITDQTGTSRNAVTSNGGKVIAFESDADILGLGLGQNESQIYVFDARVGTATLLSHGPGASRHASITHNGGLIAFESDADLSGNGTGGTQIYLYKRASAELRQITAALGGNSDAPSISSNGHALAFVSTDDLLSTDSSGPEIFSYDVKRKALRQITDGASSTADPAYAGGVFTTFLANGDLLGNGSTGLALYLVNLYALGGLSVP